jgi:hypothetical protein
MAQSADLGRQEICVLPSFLAPFDTGADFSFTATVPEEPDAEEDSSFTFTREPTVIENKAYRDTWGRGRIHTHDEESEWNKTIRALHTDVSGGVTTQLDFTATPRHSKGQLFWRLCT